MSDTIPQKPCRNCGNDYPATSDFFRVRDGYVGNVCKFCTSASNKAKYALAKSTSIEVPSGTLIPCSACKHQILATEEFFDRDPRNVGRYGFSSHCKACKSSKGKAQSRLPEVKARHREQANKHYHAHPDRCRERRMNYYYANQEVENERNRNYCHTHRSRRAESQRVYRQNHPGCREGEGCNRKAQKQSVSGSHTPEQIQAQLKRQNYRCYYAACGFAKFEKKGGKYVYHIDHTYPLSRATGSDIPANDMSYLVLACPSCNLQKWNKLPHEWPEGGRLL